MCLLSYTNLNIYSSSLVVTIGQAHLLEIEHGRAVRVAVVAGGCHVRRRCITDAAAGEQMKRRLAAARDAGLGRRREHCGVVEGNVVRLVVVLGAVSSVNAQTDTVAGERLEVTDVFDVACGWIRCCWGFPRVVVVDVIVGNVVECRYCVENTTLST